MTPVITTFTGRKLNPLDIYPSDICIEDIAHALACCNRFAGMARQPISVAQHSVYVSKLCPTRPRQGLLHDASEAYLGDVTKWLKMSDTMAGYREAEARAQATIYERFGCEVEQHPEVDDADKVMVRFEGLKAFGEDFLFPGQGYPPPTDEERARIGRWQYWSWQRAEDEFLHAYERLR